MTLRIQNRESSLTFQFIKIEFSKSAVSELLFHNQHVKGHYIFDRNKYWALVLWYHAISHHVVKHELLNTIPPRLVAYHQHDHQVKPKVNACTY